jgi:uncharacterized protein
MKKLLYVLCLYGLFSVQIALAVGDDAIYVAEVPVNSQSDQEREAAIRKGLEQVLIKVSGNPEILSSLNLKLSSNDLIMLVQEYGYFKPDGTDQSMVKISFDHEGINQLLKKARKPIWEAERASVLVWATFEAPGKPPEIIDSESTNPVRNLMNIMTRKRGISLIFPLMDLTDLNMVSVNDIETMALPTLQNASKHYNCDRILVLRVIQSATGYSAQAKFIPGHDELYWNLQDPAISSVLNKIVTQMADSLAKRYSTVVSENVQTDVTLKVVGIMHQEDFLLVKNYLKHLAIVAEVDPIEINGEEVVLHLSLRGSKDGLIQSIAAESKLLAEQDSEGEKLVYRWNNG